MPPEIPGAESQVRIGLAGKRKAFRTSGGKAGRVRPRG